MWKDMEDQQLRAQFPRSIEVVSCPHCGGTWLYRVGVNQFSTQQVTILQAPVGVHPTEMPLLVCARCGKGVRHNVAYFQVTKERQLYDQMVKETLSTEAQEQAATALKESLATDNNIPETKELDDGPITRE